MESQVATGVPLPADVAAWRPQRFGGKAARSVADPLVEPLWTGVRAMVRVGFGSGVEILDEGGRPVEGLTDVTAAVESAVRASNVVLDGYLTGQATRPTEGLMLGSPEAPSAAEMTAQLFLGSAGQRKRKELARSREADAGIGPPALVAIDLLFVDDEPLVDVPLLERKRILEGVLDEAELVRRTVFVRPPVDAWIGTWRSLGFGQLAYKAANSRYRPGQANPEWAIVSIPRR
jgi:hypothetical protein